MANIGDNEIKTQRRIFSLFSTDLKYNFLGDLSKQLNYNIREDDLKAFLQKQGYSDSLITQSIKKLRETVVMKPKENLYAKNKEVYKLLRYGTKAKQEGKPNQSVYFIDFENIENNHFAIAEEVTIKGEKVKRPDAVVYLNGIAIAVIEFKKATTEVQEAIRQQITNQEENFIRPFYATVQFCIAANDTQGLYYGTTNTSVKYYLPWKEDNFNYSSADQKTDQQFRQFFDKKRILDWLNNFVIFDFGVKKLARPNQYFGVKEAQKHLQNKKGGIIWHTQGSGKSLTMVWLAKWILENKPLGVNQRVLILTDRTELDGQISTVFAGVDEPIKRMKNGLELFSELQSNENRLICSLIHKFGSSEDDDEKEEKKEKKEVYQKLYNDSHKKPKNTRFKKEKQETENKADEDKSVFELKQKLLQDGFAAQGDFVVFIDECHRTQSGLLHKSMKELLPKNTVFIGFTGTPLLKKDKRTSLETFGTYIHTYKFDEAVEDNIVLDLLYEARDIDQFIFDKDGLDERFDRKTKGMTDYGKAKIKQRWGTLQKVLSTKERLGKVVFDIIDDFEEKPRLANKRGNALLIANSIFEACRYYELFYNESFEKCAIVTSYQPTANSTKNEHTGLGETERIEQYKIYQKMLENYGYQKNEKGEFSQNDIHDFEEKAKKLFKEEPAQMQLLIVVDKLLTGFDAIHCTYLYIDKPMQDHGLFQAVCRTNRLGKEESTDLNYKDFGYIIDYKNLFNKLQKSITDYTSGAFDDYDAEDVKGLLKDRNEEHKQKLDDSLDALHELCLPVLPPRSLLEYQNYFCGDTSNPQELKDNQEKRELLYKLVAGLVRAYNNAVEEILEIYEEKRAAAIRQDVIFYIDLRESIQKASGEYINLKEYEPEMRRLLDRYLTASPSRKISNLENASLLQLIVENGMEEAQNSYFNDSIKSNKDAMSEAVENNLRKTIIEEMPMNPAHYEKMSILLDELIKLRKKGATAYEDLLRQFEELAKNVYPKSKKENYPTTINSTALRNLYDNLDKNEALTLKLDKIIIMEKRADWIGNSLKEKSLLRKITPLLVEYGIIGKQEIIFEMIKKQEEYQ